MTRPDDAPIVSNTGRNRILAAVHVDLETAVRAGYDVYGTVLVHVDPSILSPRQREELLRQPVRTFTVERAAVPPKRKPYTEDVEAFIVHGKGHSPLLSRADGKTIGPLLDLRAKERVEAEKRKAAEEQRMSEARKHEEEKNREYRRQTDAGIDANIACLYSLTDDALARFIDSSFDPNRHAGSGDENSYTKDPKSGASFSFDFKKTFNLLPHRDSIGRMWDDKRYKKFLADRIQPILAKMASKAQSDFTAKENKRRGIIEKAVAAHGSENEQGRLAAGLLNENDLEQAYIDVVLKKCSGLPVVPQDPPKPLHCHCGAAAWPLHGRLTRFVTITPDADKNTYDLLSKIASAAGKHRNLRVKPAIVEFGIYNCRCGNLEIPAVQVEIDLPGKTLERQYTVTHRK